MALVLHVSVRCDRECCSVMLDGRRVGLLLDFFVLRWNEFGARKESNLGPFVL